jgi:CBS domain-containing protein
LKVGLLLRIKGNIVKKHDVVHCMVSTEAQFAWDLLKKSKYRCIPVLSENDKEYVGNLYRVDLAEYLVDNDSLQGKTVNDFVRKECPPIQEDSPFFKVFFTIKRFPYLAVVNDLNEFVGILTHKTVFELLEEAWGLKDGGYSLTVSTMEHEGALARLAKLVNKYSNLKSCITLDSDSVYRRILITLPPTISEDDYIKLKKDIIKKEFHIMHEEVATSHATQS